MDPDQTARMRRLVLIHAGRKPIMLVLSWRGSNSFWFQQCKIAVFLYLYNCFWSTLIQRLNKFYYIQFSTCLYVYVTVAYAFKFFVTLSKRNLEPIQCHFTLPEPYLYRKPWLSYIVIFLIYLTMWIIYCYTSTIHQLKTPY
jgi:hypothetical protein